MTDIDQLLRDFRSTVDEPPPEALARARSRAMRGGTAVRSRARWLALPATAIGVTAAAVTASLMLGQTPPPVTAPSAPPGTSASGTPAPPPTAELVEAWASDLESGPTPPPAAPGQVIILAERRFSDGAWTESCCGTVERHGLIVIDSVANDGRASFQDYVVQQRADFAEAGPSWDFPTPEWLAGLDPSPAGLGEACGARCPSVEAATCGAQCRPTEDVNCGDQCHLLDLRRNLEWQTWSAVEALVAKGDVVLPPPVRAGLLRLLGTLDPVTAYDATVDGRTLRVIGFADETGIRELYVDPVVGRFVGVGSVVTAEYPDTAECPQTWHEDWGPMPTLGPECFVAIPLAEPVRASITFWEQTVQTP